MGSRRATLSDRLVNASRAYGLARHDLIEAIKHEHSGRTVVIGRNAYTLVGTGGRTALLATRVIIHRNPESATITIEPSSGE